MCVGAEDIFYFKTSFKRSRAEEARARGPNCKLSLAIAISGGEVQSSQLLPPIHFDFIDRIDSDRRACTIFSLINRVSIFSQNLNYTHMTVNNAKTSVSTSLKSFRSASNSKNRLQRAGLGAPFEAI